MKGFCKDNQRLIGWNESTGVIDYSQLIGARVKVRRISGRTAWKNDRNTIFKIDDIKFRIQLDGKCFAVAFLKECPKEPFLLADLEIVGIDENG